MDVKIKDYEKEVHELLVALQMVGLNARYQAVYLISQTLKAQKKLGGKFSIEDAVHLKIDCEKKWTKYFKELEESN